MKLNCFWDLLGEHIFSSPAKRVSSTVFRLLKASFPYLVRGLGLPEAISKGILVRASPKSLMLLVVGPQHWWMGGGGEYKVIALLLWIKLKLEVELFEMWCILCKFELKVGQVPNTARILLVG